jgi:hypothetical protein
VVEILGGSWCLIKTKLRVDVELWIWRNGGEMGSEIFVWG